MKLIRLPSFVLCLGFIGANVGAAFDHSLFTAVLSTHVRHGLVDYLALKNDPRLHRYLEQLVMTGSAVRMGHGNLAPEGLPFTGIGEAGQCKLGPNPGRRGDGEVGASGRQVRLRLERRTTAEQRHEGQLPIGRVVVE